jgi:L-ascorbate metabolism protein UlaG (beta-lactamase superfamily)
MRRLLKVGVVGLLLLLIFGGCLVAVQLQRQPDWRAVDIPTLAAAHPATLATGQVRLRFAGVSTLVFDDGETAWMTDGFFSRPSLWAMLTQPMSPNPARITQALQVLQVKQLAAVVPLHAHYDHAMDAPVVAQRTGARLIGDASALHIGKGLGLPLAQMQEVQPQEVVVLGQFRLQFIASRHSPTLYSDGHARESITQDLVPPQRAPAWREGQVWSLWVTHAQGGSWLVQGSAGFLPGALDHVRAETVFLGVGTLGHKDTAYRSAFWQATVQAVGARHVIPVHWDNFWRPLDQPLQAMPYLFDDFAVTMQDLRTRAQANHVQLHLPPLWTPFIR